MKGDLNSMLSKEIPKIETAISAIEMGKIPFVKQLYLNFQSDNHGQTRTLIVMMELMAY